MVKLIYGIIAISLCWVLMSYMIEHKINGKIFALVVFVVFIFFIIVEHSLFG